MILAFPRYQVHIIYIHNIIICDIQQQQAATAATATNCQTAICCQLNQGDHPHCCRNVFRFLAALLFLGKESGTYVFESMWYTTRTSTRDRDGRTLIAIQQRKTYRRRWRTKKLRETDAFSLVSRLARTMLRNTRARARTHNTYTCQQQNSDTLYTFEGVPR